MLNISVGAMVIIAGVLYVILSKAKKSTVVIGVLLGVALTSATQAGPQVWRGMETGVTWLAATANNSIK